MSHDIVYWIDSLNTLHGYESEDRGGSNGRLQLLPATVLAYVRLQGGRPAILTSFLDDVGYLPLIMILLRMK